MKLLSQHKSLMSGFQVFNCPISQMLSHFLLYDACVLYTMGTLLQEKTNYFEIFSRNVVIVKKQSDFNCNLLCDKF